MQREANLIAFAKRFGKNTQLQDSISVQPRTGPGKLAYLPTPIPFSGSDQALATRNVASFASNASGMHNKRSGFIVGIGVGLGGRVGLAVGLGGRVGLAVGIGVGIGVVD